MRISFLLLTINLLTIHAVSFTQSSKVSISLEKAAVKEILSSIEEQTEYKFLYSDDFIENKFVSVHVQNTTVADVLELILKETGNSFREIENNLIVVAPFVDKIQEISIKGTVTDTDGNPLPGVNVVEKGTINGVVTNLDGEYSISVSNPDAILSFSYVGYLTEDINVGGQTTININLVEDILSLDEVVVIGYGTIKKSDLTGSVSSIKSEDLLETPLFRTDQALQGRASGVFVQNNDAAPNSETTIRIRGANSLEGGNDPLIIIDGFQGGKLSTLNPSEINSIEVLKDASATAVYGSRGANGVIIVTTKQGKEGKAKIEYNNSVSFHTIRKKLDLLSASQYAQTVNAHRKEIGLSSVFTNDQIINFHENGGTDWQDEIFDNVFSQNHLLSVSGGTDKVVYYVSGNIIDQPGIIKNTSYNRYSLRSNVTSHISEKLSVSANTYISHEMDHPTRLDSHTGDAFGNDESPVFCAQTFAPTKPIYNENGEYSTPGGGYGPTTDYNPLALAVEPIRDFSNNTYTLNGSVDYELIKGLKIQISGGYKSVDKEENSYFNSKPTNAPGSEHAIIKDSRYSLLQNTNLISYNSEIGENHSFNLTGVFEQQFEESSWNTIKATGFSSDAVTYNNMALGNQYSIPSSGRNSTTLLSYMGRVNYQFKHRYLLTITGRWDGSSVFGANNKWGFFPSVALGWNVSQENFFAQISSVNNLKLRASYGVVGNQAISPYQSLSQLYTTAYAIDGTNLTTAIIQSSQPGNPDLKWERTAQLNTGFDLSMFSSRLTIVADYYEKHTTDLLMLVDVPRTSGGTKTLRNIGEVDNKGIELYVGGHIISSDKTQWESGINFSKNNSKVVALDGNDKVRLGGPGLPNFGNAVFLQVGQPIGLIDGYIQDGIWGSSETAEAAVYGVVPGAPKYVDQNGDDEINDEDLVTIARTQPDFILGWNNTFKYKNFDLTVFINSVWGNEIYNIGRVRTERTSGDGDATSDRILDRWTPDNQDTDVPSFTGSNLYEELGSSRWTEDGSYIRVKNLTLGYNIPDQIVQKLKISSARIFLNGTNLITITDYTGYDPESSTDVDVKGGIDLASYPSQRIYTMGLNIKF